MIGDVIGNPGRVAIESLVPNLRREFSVDLVIANGENTAGGFGITPDTVSELLSNDVDVITTGNHVLEAEGDHTLLQRRVASYPAGQLSSRHTRQRLHQAGLCSGCQLDGPGLHEHPGLSLPDC